VETLIFTASRLVLSAFAKAYQNRLLQSVEVVRSAAMASRWNLVIAFGVMVFLGVVHAADPDPLQDFCVADLSSNAVLLNGLPCKPRSSVTAADFTYTGFRKAGRKQDRSNPIEAVTNTVACLNSCLNLNPGCEKQCMH